MSTSSDGKRLPAKPSLEHLQKQAKHRVRENPSLSLGSVQHQIAKEYGFSTWAELADAVQAMSASAAQQTDTTFVPTRVALEDLRPRAAWRNVGTGTASNAFESQCWAVASGNLTGILDTLVISDGARTQASAVLQQLPEIQRRKVTSADELIAIDVSHRLNFAAMGILHESSTGGSETRLQTIWKYDTGRLRENSITMVRTDSGWRLPIREFRHSPHLEARLLGISLHELKGAARAQLHRPKMPSVLNPVTGEIQIAERLIATALLKPRGNLTPAAAFETLFWAKARLDVDALVGLIVTSPNAARAKSCFSRLRPDVRERFTGSRTPERLIIFHWAARNRVVGVRLQTEAEIDPDHVYLQGAFQDEHAGSSIDMVWKRTPTGWQWLMDDQRFWPPGSLLRRPSAPRRMLYWLLGKLRW